MILCERPRHCSAWGLRRHRERRARLRLERWARPRRSRASIAGPHQRPIPRGHTISRTCSSVGHPHSSRSARLCARADTADAIFVDDGAPAVVVSAFPRTAEPAPGRVVARWADGSAAATERATGQGCIRDVAIPLARAGDLALRESTRKLVAALVSPCGGSVDFTPAADSVLAGLRGAGPLVATRALETRTAPPGHLATWLLSAALALLLLEPLLRRRRASA